MINLIKTMGLRSCIGYDHCRFWWTLHVLSSFSHVPDKFSVIKQFAGFDPFERSTYFGPHFDLGQVCESLLMFYILEWIVDANNMQFIGCFSCSLNASGESFTIQVIGFCLVIRRGKSWAAYGLRRYSCHPWKWEWHEQVHLWYFCFVTIIMGHVRLQVLWTIVVWGINSC